MKRNLKILNKSKSTYGLLRSLNEVYLQLSTHSLSSSEQKGKDEGCILAAEFYKIDVFPLEVPNFHNKFQYSDGFFNYS